MSFQHPKSPSSSSTTSGIKSPQSTTEKSLTNKQIQFDDYEGSEFEYGTEDNLGSDARNRNKQNILKRQSFDQASSSTTKDRSLPPKNVLREELGKSEGQIRAFHFISMNAYAKHIKLVNNYLQFYSGGKTLKEVFQRDASKDKTDLDVIREEMKFIWEECDEPDTWEKRLAKRYYDKLFKEYCICDLSFYKQNKIAMRWRIEKEVLTGKGQFICGEKKCQSRDGLKTWEVNFGYLEHGEKKNALVKLRLCPDCSLKLNFHHQKKEFIKPVKQKIKKREIESESDSGSESEEEEEKDKNKVESKPKKIKQSSEKGIKREDDKTVSTDGNMIILNADDSMWKNTSEKASNVEDSKSRDEDFEDYLEDLFF